MKRVSRQVGEGGSGCGTSKEEAGATAIVTVTLHRWQSQCLHCREKEGVKNKIKREPADLPFKKFWVNTKYSKDSSASLHPQLKLTRQ